ncbi:uncharacterized protein LOC130442783 [Diorhabda sublineata]|uniref:uncharacterized protein LOC130442783 n=1 Tax=Diorhabda sublineata TaxID=1163346 RepID=UPI0024E057DB|nr:uncharacterized protein LOC130442783 [Diorhabda sublineata]
MCKNIFIILVVFTAAHSSAGRIYIPSVTEIEEYSKLVREIFVEWTTRADYGLLDELSKYIDKSRDTCQNFEQKLNVTVTEVIRCQDEIKVGGNTVCNTVKSIITKCTVPARQLLSDCLPLDTKELPRLTEKILIGFVNQACRVTIEELIEFFNPCQFKKRLSEFNTCKEMKKELPTSFPNTKKVCDLLKLVKKCSNDVHSATCTNPVTLNAFAKFHKTIEDTTKDICENPAHNEV